MRFLKFNSPELLAHKGRKYPIQKDEAGYSLRKRAFILFKQGKRAAEVAEMLGMKPTTASRYFSEWNRCPPNFEGTYNILKKALKTESDLSPNVAGMISKTLGMPEWEVVDILSKPHGLKRLIKGEFQLQRNKLRYNSQEQRLEAALSLVVLYEQSGIPVELINREVRKLLDRINKDANINKGKTDLGKMEEDIPDDT
jgi:hypothetical protein